MQTRRGSSIKIVLLHLTTGALLGAFFLHPITMAIYACQYDPERAFFSTFWRFFVYRIVHTFSIEMLPMSSIFIAIGGALGLGSGIYYLIINRRRNMIDSLQRELARDVSSLIQAGEGETVEFKASVHWDLRLGKASKELEHGVIKTIAGFLNHRGGSLLVGVDDSGGVIGLEQDYQTFKRKDRDGFHQFIMRLVKTKLGGFICPLIHVVFEEIDDRDVCRVVVESSPHPVYVSDNGSEHYYLRTGNTSRELDVKEALTHIEYRWPSYQFH